ncbi:MAG TPA: hypothetical protein VFG62_08695 [Rhodopila sp.]|jgi:hypothetical protein|nr:hypothetical protein [Rhodopila sp.]
MKLDISVDVKRVTANMDFAARQIPFAAAQAATGLARLVQAEERAALSTVFDHPTKFTLNAFSVKGATKSNLVAEVFAKDKQAAYLEPSEVQGLQVLGAGTRIRTPVDIKKNASGDIPRGTIARLAGKKGFFVGAVKGIFGLWQRVSRGKVKLLVAFTRPVPVKTHLDFQKRAALVVDTNFSAIFSAALRKALRTAK